MIAITLSGHNLVKGAKIISKDETGAKLSLPAGGGGFSFPELIRAKERYAVFSVEALEQHSLMLDLFAWYRDGSRAFDIRFGILPGVPAKVCLDLTWLDGHILFPGSTPGQLKVVCHGGRVDMNEVESITFESAPCFHDVNLLMTDWVLTDQRPTDYPLPDVKLIDEFGQWKRRDWPDKIKGEGELKERLSAAANLPDEYGVSGWDEFGGFADMPLSPGTGFFTKIKKDGKWFLATPKGNAFFSVGPDCVGARADCRVDGVEKFMDWLPDKDDPEYGDMYYKSTWPREDRRRDITLFSFEQSNLKRAFGEDWYPSWQKLIVGQLKQNGMNTIGNWSDDRLFAVSNMPYVTMLPEFPSTKHLIFRDFPDVFSEEYRENAAECAEYLANRADDPYMIGYFLRNEPAWAFVDNLILADEVLYNPAPSACKTALIEALREQYGTPEALSRAWGREFDSFEALNQPILSASKCSKKAREDLRAFSRRLLDAYVSIPTKACRAVDKNHMNLGMRWAWISDPDIVTGWENFDVFSINCYSIDPTKALDNVIALGVDLPVVIGEFHAGALDGGLTATGLEGVASQADRGKAYRYYVDRVAAHSAGVGCHYFQCYDQFALGRFDGENYNIGLFDICSLKQSEMMAAVKACGQGLYDVVRGARAPYDDAPVTIPMIAY